MNENSLFPNIIGQKIIRLETVESTNSYISTLLESENLIEGTVVISKEQTLGRGQKNTVWESVAGKNLTLSIVIYPNFLRINDQFLLSKITALAVLKTVQKFLPQEKNISIKWPNDIYVNNSKISGILIENSIQNSKIRQSIIGIGININQAEFSKEINAVSLYSFLKTEINTDDVSNHLFQTLNAYYLSLISGQISGINESYHQNLYRLDKMSEFEFHGKKIQARIIGVDRMGQLQLIGEKEERLSADLKEITFVREP